MRSRKEISGRVKKKNERRIKKWK